MLAAGGKDAPDNEVVELIPSAEREGAIQTEMPRSRDLCPTPSVRAGQYSPRSTAPLVPE